MQDKAGARYRELYHEDDIVVFKELGVLSNKVSLTDGWLFVTNMHEVRHYLNTYKNTDHEDGYTMHEMNVKINIGFKKAESVSPKPEYIGDIDKDIESLPDFQLSRIVAPEYHDDDYDDDYQDLRYGLDECWRCGAEKYIYYFW